MRPPGSRHSCDISATRSVANTATHPAFSSLIKIPGRIITESQRMRKKFLTDKLSKAMDKDKTKKAKRIQEIIKREAQSKEW